MKLKRLILRNCIGIKKGLGLDEIEIDFEKFSSGVIGIFGKSGSGKSTILNNLNPYRSNFKNNFYENGYREIEFVFKGFHYLSQIYHNSAQLLKDGVILNETQKISIYDEILEHEIGDENTFYKLLFAGRRFKNIFDLTKGEKKELIVDYLLDYLKEYEQYRLKFSKEQQDKIKEKEKLEYDYNRIEEYNEDIKTYEEGIKERLQQVKETTNEQEKLVKQFEQYTEQEKENEIYKEKVREIETEISKLKKDIGNTESNIEDDEDEKEKLLKKFNDTKEQLEGIKEVDYDKDTLNKQKEECDESLERYRKQEREDEKLYDTTRITYKNSETELNRLKDDLKKKQENDLPCDSKLQIKCPLTKEQDFDGMIKQLKKEIEEKDKETEELKIRYEEYEVMDFTVKKVEVKDRIKEINKQIEELNEWNKVEGLRKLKDEYKESGMKLKQRIKVNNEKLLSYENELEAKKERLQINKDKIKTDIEDPSKEKHNNDLRLEKLKTEQENLEDHIKQLEEKITECKKNEKTIKKLETEIKEYELLIEFFGKNGGQLFDIEMAGEEISKIANQLLENYQNKTVKIKFETLKQNSKGELKEVFDINCSINQGEWQTYLSDGESVLVSNAIREAMSYIKQTKHMKTVFIDEIDGAIDGNNRVGFLKLLEQGNVLNERNFTFLISHSEEVKSHIQQSIILEDNEIILNN